MLPLPGAMAMDLGYDSSDSGITDGVDWRQGPDEQQYMHEEGVRLANMGFHDIFGVDEALPGYP